ncbi:MAG: TonB-dependent receptor [Prolixibacteraceae bacterium]|jgi:outer membrane receptor for ferrienterochelin and colicins|nr:TonB-dependent receptor [Prolixibacteraceae bacterium]
MKHFFLNAMLLLHAIAFIYAGNIGPDKKKTDANIVGHVVANGEHLPFSNVFIKGTTIGTTTDESGHFQLINLPERTYTVRVQVVGYKPEEKTVEIHKGETIELKFDLKEDVLGLDEIVITGDRNEKNRRESSVIVNTISPQLMATLQSQTLSDGLNFSPGLRMENNCQNCGFSQVRMNGMEGPYSQVLINGRPVFSGLAGVYGLELIPSNMIERVEVIRGGGSALYGSNAIAGTINLILKDPVSNAYEFGAGSGFIGTGVDNAGDIAEDYNLNFNTSIISADNKTGMSMYGYYRDRQPFDANGDTFSELTKIQNSTIGSRIFHRFAFRSKVTLDFFNIKEKRRGGDAFDQPMHESGITEAVDHNIATGAVTYEQFFREYDLFSVYASGQNVQRDSYYGANYSLKDYGKTNDFTYVIGAQYNAHFANSNLVVGIEGRSSRLKDRKLGFPDLENMVIADGKIIEIPHSNGVEVADQSSATFGLFGQYEWTIQRLNISVGTRLDKYSITDKENAEEKKSGNVFSPRLTLKYDLISELQARVSYAQGYRAPQIFDEDLHIETSGSRKVIHKNDPGLKQETSHSFMASLDYNKQLGNTSFGLLLEGFYTRLNDAFANEYGIPDENGTVVYTRINTKNGAVVRGVNLEMNLIPSRRFYLKSGFTVQKSRYEEVQEFDEKTFFRTPGQYGYIAGDWDFTDSFCFSATANFTGRMFVPHFGATSELRRSDPFFDVGMKLSYRCKLNGASVQFYTGIKNIFNSYQKDFDYGIGRDPGYVYGPGMPRMVYFGIKIGNML